VFALGILATGVFARRRKSLRGNGLFLDDAREVDFLIQKSRLSMKLATLSYARSATIRHRVFVWLKADSQWPRASSEFSKSER
jgi:hypothetical protein